MALFDQQLRNGTYAEQLFCEATAILLRVPIVIAPTTSSGKRSYYTLNAEVGGPNMMLANIPDHHFQGLIPFNEQIIIPEEMNDAVAQANDMVQRSRELGLDVTRKTVTPSDGNCFYHGKTFSSLLILPEVTEIKVHLHFRVQ